MSPRKKQKTKAPNSNESTQKSTAIKPPGSVVEPTNDVPTAKETASTSDVSSAPNAASFSGASTNDLKPRNSWYGTWPRKSIASTSVSQETILADKPTNGSSSDVNLLEPRKSLAKVDGRPASMRLGKSKETADITMGGTFEADVEMEEDKKKEKARQKKEESSRPPPLESSAASEQANKSEGSTVDSQPTTSSGWLGGWLGGPALAQTATATRSSPDDVKVGNKGTKAEDRALPTQPLVDGSVNDPGNPGTTSTSSWFGLWSTAAPSVAKAPDASEDQIPVKVKDNGEDTKMQDVSTSPETQAKAPTAGSSWAFWSVDTTKKDTSIPKKETTGSGELAVAGEASQSAPEPAKLATVKADSKPKIGNKTKQPSGDAEEPLKSKVQLEPRSTKTTSAPSATSTKTTPPNLLMPSVKSTFHLVENPSILQQIARLLLRGQQKPVKHVFLSKNPPKIRRALAVGIHGLFPAPLIRTVIGQPTGTSIRFANHAAAAIRRWGDMHGCVDCEIEKVALEGEGKIADRVDNLWKLLLNWIEHLRKADFIMVACHSQGVPVALMLVAKLIEFGVVSTAKIGVCAMAGVSLGPFPDYKSRLLTGSAGELFEFADPESVISKRYEDALKVALEYGVRVTYCGSIDDQLVSMESSVFSITNHPYIYRAVFVDGRIHAPNFISHLIGFALKLRNLGVSDHGLIRELSAPLAGSLYTGEGHSRLYDDENVYDLAIEFTLETTSVGKVSLEVQKYEIPTNANPYVLPWIMRGLLEEDFVKTELNTEVTELLKQFDDWKPSTKVLKDVKYRLEAVRSKL